MNEFLAVIFDLDGTLVDSYAPIATSLNAARAAFGLPEVALDRVRREVGHGLESLIASHLGPGRVDEGVRIFRARYGEVFAAGTRALPGVPEVPLELARRGYRLAVASNKPARFGRRIVEQVGLGAAIRLVSGPDDGVPPKPEPAMIERLMAGLATVPAQVLYVGDMPLDIESARRAGIRCALVPTGSATREELVEAAAGTGAALLDGLAGLLDHLPPRS